MAVAIDQNDRLLKRRRFLLKQRTQFGIAARRSGLAGKRRHFRKHVGLLQDHDGAAIARLRVGKGLPKPSHIGLVALGKFRVAFRRAPQTIVASGSMQCDECDAA